MQIGAAIGSVGGPAPPHEPPGAARPVRRRHRRRDRGGLPHAARRRAARDGDALPRRLRGRRARPLDPRERHLLLGRDRRVRRDDAPRRHDAVPLLAPPAPALRAGSPCSSRSPAPAFVRLLRAVQARRAQAARPGLAAPCAGRPRRGRHRRRHRGRARRLARPGGARVRRARRRLRHGAGRDGRRAVVPRRLAARRAPPRDGAREGARVRAHHRLRRGGAATSRRRSSSAASSAPRSATPRGRRSAIRDRAGRLRARRDGRVLRRRRPRAALRARARRRAGRELRPARPDDAHRRHRLRRPAPLVALPVPAGEPGARRPAPSGDALRAALARPAAELLVPADLPDFREDAPLAALSAASAGAGQRVALVRGSDGRPRGLVDLALLGALGPAELGWTRAADAMVPFVVARAVRVVARRDRGAPPPRAAAAPDRPGRRGARLDRRAGARARGARARGGRGGRGRPGGGRAP